MTGEQAVAARQTTTKNPFSSKNGTSDTYTTQICRSLLLEALSRPLSPPPWQLHSAPACYLVGTSAHLRDCDVMLWLGMKVDHWLERSSFSEFGQLDREFASFESPPSSGQLVSADLQCSTLSSSWHVIQSNLFVSCPERSIPDDSQSRYAVQRSSWNPVAIVCCTARCLSTRDDLSLPLTSSVIDFVLAGS